jgi:hypothetical protein
MRSYSLGKPKGYYREAQVTVAVSRGQRQMLQESRMGYTKERRPLTGERRVFRLCFRFALLTRGKKVPKAW